MTFSMPHIILPFLNLVLTSHLYTVSSSAPQTPVELPVKAKEVAVAQVVERVI